jgi:4'-phosphopantetheinyl transferase
VVDVFLTTPALAGDPALLAEYGRLMTEEEQKRQRAFVQERHRLEYLLTRALVRTALSRYRPVSAASWRFTTNEYGSPRVEPPCGLVFNLSNTPSMIVCAVTEGAAIGVDVEPHDRGGQVLDVAESVFAPLERAGLEALPEGRRRDRALSLWTLKEAYIKARGMGLSLPLNGFAFRFDDPDDVPRITFAPSIADDPGRWWFRTIDHVDHRVAICAERTATAESPEGTPRLRVRLCVPLRDDQDVEVTPATLRVP